MAASGKLLLALIYINVLGYSCLETTEQVVKTRGKPWPMPQHMKQTADTFIIVKEKFQITIKGKTCDILDAAIVRYEQLIFHRSDPVSHLKNDNTLKFKPRYMEINADTQTLKDMNIYLNEPCESAWPSLQMNESYVLQISKDTVALDAPSIWGILHGLETFSQLVQEGEDGMYTIAGTYIIDNPRFAYRGMLLDSSRHFIPLKVIKQNLDAMAYNKLNVFHWHIVDDPSFPYQSRQYPNLSNKGAYNPYTHVYSQADISEVLEYARLRGIRVIPEFDSPGHTQSWGKGQPGLLTPCYKDGKPTGSYGPIDPSVNTTYDFLSKLMKEVSAVFPDKYVHLGGDEVSFSCWKSNPNITEFMAKMGFGTDYAKLEEYYMQRLLDIVGSYDSEYIIWQEVIDNGCKVRPDTVVEVWKGGYENELAKVTKQGYKTILSSCWYLNDISYGTDWHPYYTCDPQHFNGTAQQKNLVIGGELCMWGEWVDATNLISRSWPRACAVAERLWSAESMKDASAAAGRMEEQRCRMISDMNTEMDTSTPMMVMDTTLPTIINYTAIDDDMLSISFEQMFNKIECIE